MIHLVQISNGSSRRVAIVEEPYLRCLTEVQSVYELAQAVSTSQQRLERAGSCARNVGSYLIYDSIYSGTSEWHLLAPIDVPGERIAPDDRGYGPDAPGKRERSAGYAC